MKNNTLLKILNPILGILMINQVLTGVFHDSLSRELFELLHEGGGTLLAIGALLHVTLNWSWIKTNFLKKPLVEHKMK